jgi:hypothetical protein
MKYLITILFVFIVSVGFGQKTIDTNVMYNGEQLKEKIAFDNKGQKTKETTFYKNGKIIEEHFYQDGKDFKWITYDSTGAQNGEWYSPEIEKSRFGKERNTVLLLTCVFLLGVISLSWKYLGYKGTYYWVAIATVLFPIFSMIFNALDKIGEIPGLILVSITLELPAVLLIGSFRNLLKSTGIHIVITVISIVVSLALIVMYVLSIASASAGPGMIG